MTSFSRVFALQCWQLNTALRPTKLSLVAQLTIDLFCLSTLAKETYFVSTQYVSWSEIIGKAQFSISIKKTISKGDSFPKHFGGCAIEFLATVEKIINCVLLLVDLPPLGKSFFAFLLINDHTMFILKKKSLYQLFVYKSRRLVGVQIDFTEQRRSAYHHD